MKKTTILFLLTALLFGSTKAFAQTKEEQFDALLQETYNDSTPGVATLVYKDGKVLYRKAFGMANLELEVPMKPEHIFEIGSITKQFTAVSILMLLEQGKLNLEDEITKYIPDYPTNGKTITIHHLLNHTSGIKSYTSMGSFMSTAATDKTPTEIIDVFKNEPMDFDPGEKWLYNNSGYIILGHIIEEISEKSYAEFIEENIFIPLKMENSYYGSKSKLIKNRATGYTPAENGFRNARYLSMTLPYAAGSIMSTVDDMLLWNKAIHNNTLITAKSKALAFTNSTLNNGDATNYGYGWQMNTISDVPSIEHGGGIFGYVTNGLYLPSEDVYVIALTNRDGSSPEDAAVKMAAIALGNPYDTSDESLSLSTEELNKWVGNYEFDEAVLRTIYLEDGQLYSQRDGGGKSKIYADSADKFHFEGGLSTYEFQMENGKKTVVFKARINTSKGVETDRKPGTEKEEISVDTSNYEDYVGSYELVPGFAITITTKEDQLFAQATGQQNFPVFPEAKDTFFYKVVSAQLVFERNDNGEVINLTLHQNGQSLKGDKK